MAQDVCAPVARRHWTAQVAEFVEPLRFTISEDPEETVEITARFGHASITIVNISSWSEGDGRHFLRYSVQTNYAVQAVGARLHVFDPRSGEWEFKCGLSGPPRGHPSWEYEVEVGREYKLEPTFVGVG